MSGEGFAVPTTPDYDSEAVRERTRMALTEAGCLVIDADPDSPDAYTVVFPESPHTTDETGRVDVHRCAALMDRAQRMAFDSLGIPYRVVPTLADYVDAVTDLFPNRHPHPTDWSL